MNCVPALNRKTDKQMFIIKVYGILACTLAFTMLFTLFVYTSESFQAWMKANMWMHWLSFGGGLTLSMVLMCPCGCQKAQRKVPLNYILLALFTFFESYIIAGFCSYFDPIPVLAATVTTTFMVIGLTLYGCFMSEDDMNLCIALAFGLSCSLLPLVVMCLFFWSWALYMLVLFVIVALYSIFLVIDTRMIMTRCESDEYVIAVVFLYLDIITLFLYILQIFGAAMGEN